jgi:hypothetical protein
MDCNLQGILNSGVQRIDHITVTTTNLLVEGNIESRDSIKAYHKQ